MFEPRIEGLYDSSESRPLGFTNQIVFTSSISNTGLFAGVKTEYASTAFSSSGDFTPDSAARLTVAQYLRLPYRIDADRESVFTASERDQASLAKPKPAAALRRVNKELADA